MINRVILIVTDSLGIGALPDAAGYFNSGIPDTDADTLGHIAEKCGNMNIPNISELGIGNIDGICDTARKKYAVENPKGAFGKAKEMSSGKDTITGHWEIAGLVTQTPFKTYPDGFPEEFIEIFQSRIGREVLGNYAASGTVIIDELGDEHESTGKPIVYTSADSVFQIAADTAVIPLQELYGMCETARELLQGEWACGRVIARPYVKKDGKRVRTSERKDYAVSPPEKTVLNNICDSGRTVYAIGKISDIFNGSGITKSVHTENNEDGCSKTAEAIHRNFKGMIFTNLVEFDSLYGHRRNTEGYANAIEEFDKRLPEIKAAMKDDDVLIICADHGNDPSYAGWDHTREYVPILIYGKHIKEGMNIGTRSSFADIGASIAEMLNVEKPLHGESFAKDITDDIIDD